MSRREPRRAPATDAAIAYAHTTNAEASTNVPMVAICQSSLPGTVTHTLSIGTVNDG